ncbi:MAG: LptF/LptG family permease [Alphaproteobacteria bacterium]|nr:LptF/LptG family permease [Alphaproteobacteria bacterium]
MTQLTRYIFRQLFFTVLVATMVLTCILWLAQSLRYIDFIANKGIPMLLFLEMIFYLLPNLVVIVVPVAVLIGVLFIYNKLIADHELVVMQGSGISFWQLAKPAVLLGSLFALFLYSFTFYFLPLSFRKYRDITLALREKSLASLVQVGQFNSLGRYTVYARSQDSQGNFLGILIYDGSQGEKATTFMAEKGVMFNKEEGGRLLLLKGNRQEKDIKTGKPSILYFDQYTIEAKDKSSEGGKEGRILKAYECYVGELLYPKESISPSLRMEYLSAAHQRILSPLYSLAFALLGVCTMVLGYFNRKGRTGKIVMACVIASLLEVGAMVFLHTLKYAAIMIPLSYGFVIVTVGICLFLLSPWANRAVNSLKRLRFR